MADTDQVEIRNSKGESKWVPRAWAEENIPEYIVEQGSPPGEMLDPNSAQALMGIVARGEPGLGRGPISTGALGRTAEAVGDWLPDWMGLSGKDFSSINPGSFIGGLYDSGVNTLDQVQSALNFGPKAISPENPEMTPGENFTAALKSIPYEMLNAARQAPEAAMRLPGQALDATARMVANTADESLPPQLKPTGNIDNDIDSAIIQGIQDGSMPFGLGPILRGGVRTVREMIPPGQEAETIGALLASAIPAARALKKPFQTAVYPLMKTVGINPNVALPAAAGLAGGFLANQGEQLVGADKDTPILDDLADLTRQGAQTAGIVGIGEPSMKITNSALMGISQAARKQAEAMNAFRDKDLQRVLAFYDDPADAVTRQGIPMRDALAEPDVKPLLQNFPKNKKKLNEYEIVEKRIAGDTKAVEQAQALYKKAKTPEQQAVAAKAIADASGEINRTGNEIDRTINTLPATAKMSVGEFLDSEAWKNMEALADGGGIGPEARLARNIMQDEYIQLALRARESRSARPTPIFSDLDANEFEQLVRKRFRTDTGAKALGASQDAQALTAKEKQRFDDLKSQLVTDFWDVSELRARKTSYDRFGQWDKTHTADQIRSADFYRDLASAYRDKIHTLFEKYKPGEYEKYKAANKRFQTLQDLLPQVGERAKQERFRPMHSTGSFQAKATTGMDDFTGAGITPDKFVNVDTPVARLYAASDHPYEQMNNYSLALRDRYLNIKSGFWDKIQRVHAAAGGLVSSPAGGMMFGVTGAQDASPPTFARSTGDIFGTPEERLPQELVNAPGFKEMRIAAQRGTEEHRRQKLADFIMANEDLAEQFFERPEYRGYTSMVKGDDSNWYIMDKAQRKVFAEQEIRRSDDPEHMKTNKLEALFRNGKVLRGGPVEMSPEDKDLKTVKTAGGSRQDPGF